MAFETEAATVYQIRPRHCHEEVQEVISVVRTLVKHGLDSLVENLYQLFRGPDVQAVPP